MRRSYWVYSAGLAVVWAVVLALAFAARGAAAFPVLWVFCGFALAWISGTIARQVYPPPARWRRRDPDAEG